MTPNLFGSSKSTALILLRLENDNINFRYEQKDEYDSSREARAQAERDDLEVAAEEERYESEPNDARRVHAEADELGLVEVLGQIARSHRVERAHCHQAHVVADRTDYRPLFVGAH